MSNSGKLYIVATPLGNLKDITLRAIEVLRSVSVIACEDTRRSRKLLSHYEIKAKLISSHSFNEKSRVDQLIAILKNCDDVAVVSDAGTPLLSDPGHVIVAACVREKIPVVPIPGPSAVSSAVSICHFDVGSFCFLGFLPAKSTQRKKLLKRFATFPYAMVFYEAPHRILTFLESLEEILGDRECMICRELTKVYEEVLRGTLSDVSCQLKDRPSIKGEFTIVVEGASQKLLTHPEDKVLHAHCKKFLEEGFTPKQVALIIQHIFGISRNRAYSIVMQAKGQTRR